MNGWAALTSMIALLFIAGCSTKEENYPAILYRNSNFDRSMRVHFSSFDAHDKGSFNIDNCEMVARLLNANIIASAKTEGKPPHDGVGFWCEIGRYREVAPVPTSFEAEYPTDSKPFRRSSEGNPN